MYMYMYTDRKEGRNGKRIPRNKDQGPNLACEERAKATGSEREGWFHRDGGWIYLRACIQHERYNGETTWWQG